MANRLEQTGLLASVCHTVQPYARRKAVARPGRAGRAGQRGTRPRARRKPPGPATPSRPTGWPQRRAGQRGTRPRARRKPPGPAAPSHPTLPRRMPQIALCAHAKQRQSVDWGGHERQPAARKRRPAARDGGTARTDLGGRRREVNTLSGGERCSRARRRRAHPGATITFGRCCARNPGQSFDQRNNCA